MPSDLLTRMRAPAESVSLLDVLVVDDDSAVLDMLRELLLDAGLSVIALRHGYAALHCAQAQCPRLILLDLQMPDLDGIELFRLLRSHPTTLNIPVLFVTANAHVLVEHHPDYALMNARLLAKPFDTDTLVAHARAMLQDPPTP